jgi:ATP-dependent DNA helicase RecG
MFKISIGRTKGVEYFVNPKLLQKAKFKGKTNLKKIEVHRLRELIYQDVLTYPESSIADIHQRVGLEIPKHKIKKQLYQLVEDGTVIYKGSLRWRQYYIEQKSVK